MGINKNDTGFVYVMGMSQDAELFKIGYTKDIYRRLREANRSEFNPYTINLYILWHGQEALYDKVIHKKLQAMDEKYKHIKVDPFGTIRDNEWFCIPLYEIWQLFAGTISSDYVDIRKLYRTYIDKGIIHMIDSDGNDYELSNKKEPQARPITHSIEDLYNDGFEYTDFGYLLRAKLRTIPFVKSREDYDNNESRYEYAMATFYSGQVKKIITNLNKSRDAITLKYDLENSYPEEEIFAVYETLEYLLRHRPAHDEIINGVPYLLNLACKCRAYVYRKEDNVIYYK